MHERVGVEVELLDGEPDGLAEERRTGSILVRPQERLEPARDARLVGHSPDVGHVHDPLALADGELAEEEESLARRGRDPVGIAAAGVQQGHGGLLGAFLGERDQLVLDLERAELRVLVKGGKQLGRSFAPLGRGAGRTGGRGLSGRRFGALLALEDGRPPFG